MRIGILKTKSESFSCIPQISHISVFNCLALKLSSVISLFLLVTDNVCVCAVRKGL